MKVEILLFAIIFSQAASAQKISPLFAITDQTKGGIGWNAIRQLNATGDEPALLENSKATGVVMDARAQQKLADYSPVAANYKAQPLYSGVAALAYDQYHHRLYYATMTTQQLRYINLGEKTTGYYEAGDIPSVISRPGPAYKITPQNQAPVISRMVIAADGNGYGLSNDGISFFRFSLNKKTSIQELGPLVDDSNNGSVSVHNACSSWGGDLIAAATGELYLFTMPQHVFRIHPDTRVATYLGHIKGLPDGFTVNGAAVTDEGKVLLSTAAYAGSRAVITDWNNLQAELQKSDAFYNASDLASANLLFENKTKTIEGLPLRAIGNERISIYPNPVTNGFALISFDKMKAGRYNIDLLSSSGSLVLRQQAVVNAEEQQVRINTRNLGKGLYVIRVADAGRKEILAARLVIQ